MVKQWALKNTPGTIDSFFTPWPDYLNTPFSKKMVWTKPISAPKVKRPVAGKNAPWTDDSLFILGPAFGRAGFWKIRFWKNRYRPPRNRQVALEKPKKTLAQKNRPWKGVLYRPPKGQFMDPTWGCQFWVLVGESHSKKYFWEGRYRATQKYFWGAGHFQPPRSTSGPGSTSGTPGSTSSLVYM